MSNKEPTELKKSDDKIKQAASVLLSLGPQNAARVLRHLEPEEVEKLMREVIRLGKGDDTLHKKNLQELKRELEKLEQTTHGGKEQARALLVAAMGEKKAAEVLERLELRDIGRKFHELEEYSADQFAQVLSNDSDQTVAVILSQLHPPYAAQVLSRFDGQRKAEIARKIAYLREVHPQVLNSVVESLRRKLEQLETEQLPQTTADGENILAQILKHMPPDNEENLLKALEQEEPEIADRLKAKMFVFEDLLEIDKEGIRRLVEVVPDPGVWARALKGAGNTLRRHILSSISLNRASDITEEMARIGAVALREVENERRVIMRAAEQLRETREIYFARDRQDLIS